jgi:hypothetical protein
MESWLKAAMVDDSSAPSFDVAAIDLSIFSVTFYNLVFI